MKAACLEGCCDPRTLELHNTPGSKMLGPRALTRMPCCLPYMQITLGMEDQFALFGWLIKAKEFAFSVSWPVNGTYTVTGLYAPLGEELHIATLSFDEQQEWWQRRQQEKQQLQQQRKQAEEQRQHEKKHERRRRRHQRLQLRQQQNLQQQQRQQQPEWGPELQELQLDPQQQLLMQQQPGPCPAQSPPHAAAGSGTEGSNEHEGGSSGYKGGSSGYEGSDNVYTESTEDWGDSESDRNDSDGGDNGSEGDCHVDGDGSDSGGEAGPPSKRLRSSPPRQQQHAQLQHGARSRRLGGLPTVSRWWATPAQHLQQQVLNHQQQVPQEQQVQQGQRQLEQEQQEQQQEQQQAAGAANVECLSVM